MFNVEKSGEIFLKTFIEFSEFRQLFLANWEVEFFNTREDKVLYKMLKAMWLADHKILTKKDVLMEITNKKTYDKIRESLAQKIETVYNIDLSEFTESFVRDQFLDILRKNKLEKSLGKIVEEIGKGGNMDLPLIKNDILKTLDINDALQDLGIDYYDGDLLGRMKILQELQVSHFKTGFNKDLDDLLRLKRKTLVAVSAQLNVGKSLFLNNLAVNISQEGHNVLYLSLEMDAYDISKRLDRIALNFHEDEYFKDMDLVDKKMAAMQKEYPKHGKLFIRSYSPRSLTTFQIRSLLETYRLKNVGIDVILVDYLTLMKSDSSKKDDNMYQKGKDIAEELRALAVDERCLVFTALQVKGEAYGKNKQGAELIAESLAIPQILDTLINMTEIVVDEGDQKFLVLSFEKVRDSKRTNKHIYLKLKDNLRIVSTTEEEKTHLEEIMTKKKKSVMQADKIKEIQVDLDTI